jgi:hypothetical protein
METNYSYQDYHPILNTRSRSNSDISKQNTKSSTDTDNKDNTGSTGTTDMMPTPPANIYIGIVVMSLIIVAPFVIYKLFSSNSTEVDANQNVEPVAAAPQPDIKNQQLEDLTTEMRTVKSQLSDINNNISSLSSSIQISKKEESTQSPGFFGNIFGTTPAVEQKPVETIPQTMPQESTPLPVKESPGFFGNLFGPSKPVEQKPEEKNANGLEPTAQLEPVSSYHAPQEQSVTTDETSYQQSLEPVTTLEEPSYQQEQPVTTLEEQPSYQQEQPVTTLEEPSYQQSPESVTTLEEPSYQQEQPVTTLEEPSYQPPVSEMPSYQPPISEEEQPISEQQYKPPVVGGKHTKRSKQSKSKTLKKLLKMISKI